CSRAAPAESLAYEMPACVALSRKQGFESPRERQRFQSFSSDALVLLGALGSFWGVNVAERWRTTASTAAYRRCQSAQARSRPSGQCRAAIEPCLSFGAEALR